MAESSSSKSPVAGFSPVPGCVILVSGGVLLILMLVWGIYSFTKTAREVISFTDEKAVPVVAASPTEAQRQALMSKLEAFEKQVLAGHGPELVLTTDDLNQILCSDEKKFGQIKDMIGFKRITEKNQLEAQLSLPLNTYPGRPVRWLHGSLLCSLKGVPAKGITLATEMISTTDPSRPLPEGFQNNYRYNGYLDEMLLKEFRDDARIGRILRVILDAEIKDNKIILKAAKGVPAEVQED